MAQSLLMAVRGRYPEIVIDVLAPAWSRPLLRRMPQVREAIEMPLGHGQLDLRARRRLGLSLRERDYDWAIVLPNSFKSALAPFWARIPRRTGYLGEWRWGLLNDSRRLDKTQLPMTVQRFVALGLAPEAELPPAVPPPRLRGDAASSERTLARLGLRRPGNRLLVLCPGAEFGPAKRWPEAHYAQVARTLATAGWVVWILGSKKDAPVAEAVAKQARTGVNLAGRTSLEQAIDLLSLADAVVSNDSGLMHVAAALERPVIAIYGSSDPGFTPPLNPRARIVRLGLSCSPCFKRECPLGHLDCLRKLEPQRVLARIPR
jgi:heptosyltransferase-2